MILVINGLLFLYFVFSKHYPFWLVFIHFLSIIYLLFLQIKKNRIKKFIIGYLKEILIGLVFFITALFLYLYKIDIITPGMWGDEVTVGRMAEKLLTLKDFTPYININFGHPTPLLYLTGLLIKLFGRSILTIRLVSVIFGAFSVAGLFVLLRIFFKRPVAIIVTTLFMFSYMQIIVTRFGYEISAGIFLQILSLIFLALAYLRKDKQYFILFGLAIGAGLFSYLAFRLVAVALVIISFLFIQYKDKKDRLTKYGLIVGSIFLVTITLSSYAINHPGEMLARTRSVSLFNQGFSQTEMIKEFSGSVSRIFGMFISVGDPNPRQNPAATTPFDNLTVILLIFSLLIVIRENKKFAGLFILLFLVNLMNDLLTVERIPEFHYYGLGHPNTLRIAGILPIIYFLIAYGFDWLIKQTDEKYRQGIILAITIVTIMIIFINFSRYYYQPFSFYNYEINGVRMLKIADYVNKLNPRQIFISPTFIKDDRFDYFINKKIILHEFNPTGNTFTPDSLPKSKTIIFDPKTNMGWAVSLTDNEKKFAPNFKLEFLTNPRNNIEAVIIHQVVDNP